jgi:hypothetical protein
LSDRGKDDQYGYRTDQFDYPGQMHGFVCCDFESDAPEMLTCREPWPVISGAIVGVYGGSLHK